METLAMYYQDNVRRMNELLGAGRCCDMVSRDYLIGGRKARIWVVDGFGQDSILERLGSVWLTLKPQDVGLITKMDDFVLRFVTFSEVNTSENVDDIVTAVLLGKTLLLMDGVRGAALIDAKDFPTRSVDEPADGKVLRGSHDGFVEAMVPNLALLRRRIRDPHFTTEAMQLGSRSRTDAALCYLNDRADPSLLAELRQKLQSIDVRSLSMGQESIAEAIRPKQWYNPFPKVRYSERPDTAAATVLEGGVVLLVDNSPAAMLLPTSFFDFVQEANDFYFPPLTGTYLRLLRMIVFFLSLFITPVWYLMVENAHLIPDGLQFLASPDESTLSLLWQLLIVEFLVDVLKLASLNTPDSLSNSFSMLGALILGDFAVQAGWLSPEVLVYMAFVSVAGFAQPGYELGYAFKLLRLVLLGLSAALGVWGFAAGTAGILLLLITCRPIAGPGYLYPLIPFNGRALRRLLLREHISWDNT